MNRARRDFSQALCRRLRVTITSCAGQQSLAIDLRVFSLSVVQRAAHAISGDADVEVRIAGEHEVEVKLSPLRSSASDLAATFRRLLTDFAVQAEVNAETRTVRDALITAALTESLRSRASS
jgi:His-Xaa-Ser system protein HxsD